MSRAMLRYEVLVNDRPQTFLLPPDNPRHVSAARLGVGPNAQHTVEFWLEGDVPDGHQQIHPSQYQLRAFQVFGTGHPLPDAAAWRGTCDRTPEGLVWHLYEVPQ